MSWLLNLFLILCLLEGLRRFMKLVFSLISKGNEHLKKKMIEDDPMIVVRMSAQKELDEEWDYVLKRDGCKTRKEWLERNQDDGSAFSEKLERHYQEQVALGNAIEAKKRKELWGDKEDANE
jgi:hypothetical protein